MSKDSTQTGQFFGKVINVHEYTEADTSNSHLISVNVL